MPDPLNPVLYQTLRTRFGDVRVGNAGEIRRVRHFPDPAHPGRLKERTLAWGEQYLVNCPLCADSRHRLAISYTYGQRDPRTGHVNYSAAYCQNEHCFRDAANRALLREMLEIPLCRRARQRSSLSPPQAETQGPPPPTEVAPPERIVPINQLPGMHPAVQYLRDRQFDPEVIWRERSVYYCERSDYPRPPIRNALVIPIYQPRTRFSLDESANNQEPIISGWQARALNPSPGQPKYLSAADVRIKQFVYGLPYAIRSVGPVLLCEGVFDAWRIGSSAVALFGKTLASAQKSLLIHFFRDRPIVVLLDPDARCEADAIASELRLSRPDTDENRVVVAELPPNRDPADCTWQEVTMAAALALGYRLEDLGIDLPEAHA